MNESCDVFSAILDINKFSALLKPMLIKDNVHITISNIGLRFTVDDSKTLQINAYLSRDLFEEFSLKTEQIEFATNLLLLTQVLNISESLNLQEDMIYVRLSLRDVGSPFMYQTSVNGKKIKCSLRTQIAENMHIFDFNCSNVVAKVIMKPELLHDALSDLDANFEFVDFSVSAESFTVGLSSHAATLTWSTVATTEKIEFFDVSRPIKTRFACGKFKMLSKAGGSKLSLRLDENGFMCLQFLVDYTEGRSAFLEFYFSPCVVWGK